MIRSIKIRNFKSLKELQISSLSRITLFGGKNNVGKSTLLEAIFLFLDRMNPNMTIRQFNWRGMQNIPLNPESMFAPIFTNFDMQNTIEVSATYEQNIRETMLIKFNNQPRSIIMSHTQPNNIEKQIKTNQDTIASSTLEIAYDKTNIPTQNVNLIINNQGLGMEVNKARSGDIKAAFVSARLNIDPRENAIRFSDLDIKGGTEQIIKNLNIIEPKLKGLSVITAINGTSMIYGDLGIGKKVPTAYMGDGFNRLMTILLVIASTENGVVFIDEIENGIHYSVISDIWKVISHSARDFNCQIISTTHSYECLQSSITGITEDLKDEFTYIRLERGSDTEKITPKYFPYDVLKAAIHHGLEVR